MTFSAVQCALFLLQCVVTASSYELQACTMSAVPDPASIFGHSTPNPPTLEQYVVLEFSDCNDRCCTSENCTVAVFLETDARVTENCDLYACRPTNTCTINFGDGQYIFVKKEDNNDIAATPISTGSFATSQEVTTIAHPVADEVNTTFSIDDNNNAGIDTYASTQDVSNVTIPVTNEVSTSFTPDDNIAGIDTFATIQEVAITVPPGSNNDNTGLLTEDNDQLFQVPSSTIAYPTTTSVTPLMASTSETTTTITPHSPLTPDLATSPLTPDPATMAMNTNIAVENGIGDYSSISGSLPSETATDSEVTYSSSESPEASYGNISDTTIPLSVTATTSSPDNIGAILAPYTTNNAPITSEISPPLVELPTTTNPLSQPSTDSEETINQPIFPLVTFGPPSWTMQTMESNIYTLTSGDMATSRPSDDSNNSIDIFIGEKSNSMTAILICALTFGCVFVLAVVAVLGKRIYEGYKKRHYSRLDYLINGMYN